MLVEPGDPSKGGVLSAKLDEVAGEGDELGVGVLPVEPRELIVLVVGVVVPVLGAAHLVTAEKHRYALGEDHGGEEGPLSSAAEGEHGGVCRPAFEA